MHGTIGLRKTTTIAVPYIAERPSLPDFKPRWWYRSDRLDARPVIWSLYNHPEEWEWQHVGYRINHKPSSHMFWVANGRGYYRLDSVGVPCGCLSAGGYFQMFQQIAFHKAFTWWSTRAMDSERFADHFIH